MPTMPVGTEFFDKLVSGNYYFVDKTAYIKEFYEHKSDVTLITRPRRFGKTLFMQMLKEFFSVENAGKKNIFEGLAISEDKEFCGEHQHKYPVIFFTLKEIKDANFADARISFSQRISSLFSEFAYLKQSERLDADDKQAFAALCGRAREDLSWKSLSVSVKLLTELLHKHHGAKPVVLLDEYDTPIQIAWQKGYYDEMIDFMKAFLGNILKTNPAMNFAVLTGVTRVSKESIFSDLNNLNVITVTTDKLNKIMGFTEAEVLDLAEQINAEDKLPEIKQWYDGYNFGGAEIYNPFSVVKYFYNGCKPEANWINTSSNGILKEMLQYADAERVAVLQSLLQGKTVTALLLEKIVYGDIFTNDDALYTMLLTTGYLKAIKVEYTLDGVICELKIPNLEVYQAYKNDVIGYVTHDLAYAQVKNISVAITGGDAEQLQKCLSDMLMRMVSVYDVESSSENRESFYHGLMLGLTAMLQADYSMESNWESGYGRFDVALFPKRAGLAGVIMEFKSRNKLKRWANYDKFQMAKALGPTCKKALAQIDEKAYVAAFQSKGIDKVAKIGIAFCGKYVAVQAE